MRKNWIFSIVSAIVLLVVAVAGGILYLAVNPSAVFAQTGSGQDAGILVGSVAADSPAAKAGVVRGDIILEANGKAVNQPAELGTIMNALKAGDTLTLKVQHGDQTRDLKVTLGDQNGKAYLGIAPANVFEKLYDRFFGRGSKGGGAAPAALKGALVVEVVAGGPAEKAGLKAGDQILSVNGKEISGSNDLTAAIQALKPGDVVTLSVQKKGETSAADVKVTLGTDPNKAGQAYLGLSYHPGRPGMQEKNGAGPQGSGPDFGRNGAKPGMSTGAVVVSVAAGSPAEKAGLKAKDLITAVNGKAITTAEELTSLVKAAKVGDKLTLTITRSGEQNPLSLDVVLAANPDNSGAPYMGVSLGGGMRGGAPRQQNPGKPNTAPQGTSS